MPNTRASLDSASTSIHTDASIPVTSVNFRLPRIDSLPRERLEGLLDGVWSHRLGLVVAPAGSGKTSLLARFAHRCAVPVAWYRAEPWDDDVTTVLRRLEVALGHVVDGLEGSWGSVDVAIDHLESCRDNRTLLIIDDFHELEGSRAEAALERLIEYRPPWLAIAIGTRVQPGFNLSRLRVSNAILEIGPDDLRFRSWEVEELFRNFYSETVPPQELALLARRTEGWAAALQLFHLATRTKSPDERRQVLMGGGQSSQLLREYLTHNVLDGLPREVRDFLVETCVLGRLTGSLCDDLIGRSGSIGVLEDLERRGVFTVRLEEEGTYRYHEVFRAHLQSVLVSTVGEANARDRYRRAGRLLEASGALADALAAYSRADDAAAVRHLLRGEGAAIAADTGAWFEGLPRAITRHDPWLMLAEARRGRAEGRWRMAVESYRRAEASFRQASPALLCRRERLEVATWVEGGTRPGRGWSGILRAAVTRDPLRANQDVGRLPEEHQRLAKGLVALLAGRVSEARLHLLEAAEEPDVGPTLSAGARLAAGVAECLAGEPGAGATLDRAVSQADLAGSSWLARLARSLSIAFDTTAPDQVLPRPAPGGEPDAIGDALVALAEAWGTPRPDSRLEAAERAAAVLGSLDAGVLAAWARSLAALAMAEVGASGATAAATAAEAYARSKGAGGARLFACLALASSTEQPAPEYAQLAEAIRVESGLVDPPRAMAEQKLGAPPGQGHKGSTREGMAHPAAARPDQPMEVRALGSFTIDVGSLSIDLSGLRPRARSLLRFLVLHQGELVHKESIIDALWRETEAASASRSLHVGISSIRGLLKQQRVGDGRVVVRAGDAYTLVLGSDCFVDFVELERAVNVARVKRLRGDLAGAVEMFRSALALYWGDLLSEEGPAEWTLDRREQCRTLAVSGATSWAEIALVLGDLEGAALACRTGLAMDRYHDPLWRLLIESREGAGDTGAALKARHDYAVVLDALGLDPVSTWGSNPAS